MLILTRKHGEAIKIGDNIKIIVMQIKGKQVRLGIKADSDIKIERDELCGKYQKAKDSESYAVKL